MVQCSSCLTFCPEKETVTLNIGGLEAVICHDCYPEIAKVFDAPAVVHDQEEANDAEAVQDLQ